MIQRTIDIPISRVTLLEDRGYVTRKATLEVEPGASRFRLNGVSTVIVDKTLTARFAQGWVKLHDVRVERTLRAQAEAPGGTEDRTQHLRLAEIQQDLQALAHERTMAGNLRQQFLEESARDVAWGVADPTQWEERLAELNSWVEDLAEKAFELEQAALQVGLEAKKVAESRRAYSAPARPEGYVVLEFEASQGGTVELTIEYSVPGACWRPYHTATLGQSAVSFRCDACVWQNTGEDWNEVELLFSTQRPSLGTEPPKLSRDSLRAGKKKAEIVVEARDQEVTTLAQGTSRTVRSDIPGIDDGGQVLQLKAAGLCSVASNGQPRRVELFRFESPCVVQRVLLPEVYPVVILKSSQANDGVHPLLAGPVDLIWQGGLAGRTTLMYVAPREKFDLGWGPVADLRVHRQATEGSEAKDDMMGGWFKTEHTVCLNLSNLAEESRDLVVTERIPVSEVKQVEIAMNGKHTTGNPSVDENGFVHWNVELGPRERRTLFLSYHLRRRKEVVAVKA